MIADYDELRQIAGEVSRETFDSLVDLKEELIRWNKQINLVSPSTIDQVWRRHFLDSAQLYPLAGQREQWIDLGSGGGFPGLVIATLRKPLQNRSTTLVESNRKKTSFLRHIVGKADLNCNVESVRIEDYVARTPSPDVISARALAPLSDLLALTGKWLDGGATALFHKGRDYTEEIRQASALDRYDMIEHPSVVDADSVILEIKRKKHDS